MDKHTINSYSVSVNWSTMVCIKISFCVAWRTSDWGWQKNAFYCICVNQQFWYTTVGSSVYIFMNHTGDAHHLTTKVLFLTLCGDHNHNHIGLCFVLGCPQPHPCSSVHRQYLNTYIVSYMYDLWGRRRYVKNPHPWTLTKGHVASQWGWSLSDSCHAACTMYIY